MAIKLISNYSKRLGLPGYSSHQFSVSVESELIDTGEIESEVARVYELLQHNVDDQIQQTGFVPDERYGSNIVTLPSQLANRGKSEGANGDASWKCSDKQRNLILKLVDEHKLDRDEVDHLARQRFGKGVRFLGKIEASGLIDELLETHGKKGGNSGSPPRRRNAYAGGSR